MVGMERAYNFHKLVVCANTVNHLSQIEYGGNGIKFGQAHNKMNNIWGKMHELRDNEVPPNLANYTVVATDELVIEALKEGLKDAQRLINTLNMAPNAQASSRNKDWFHKPWISEQSDPQSFAYAAPAKPVHGEDGDMEVLREDLQQKEQEMQRRNVAGDLSPKQN